MALKENYRELLIDAVVRVAAREGLDPFPDGTVWEEPDTDQKGT